MSVDLGIKQKEILLVEFRERVPDLLPSLKDDFQRSDAVLEKFLVARGYNLRKAEETFRKIVEWRQANGADTILERPFCHEMDPHYKVFLTGFDKQGHPVFLLPAGQWNAVGILESRTKAEVAVILTQYIEKVMHICRMISGNGKTIAKCFLIVDCADFDYKLLTHPKFLAMGLSWLRDLSQMLFDYYPECMEQSVVVNASPMFRLLWAIIKPLLPRGTLPKISIHGTNAHKWKKCLLERINSNSLPSKYGGADTTGLIESRFFPDKDFLPRAKLELLASEDLLECYVEPGKSFSVQITTKPGDDIVWNFKTEERDIGFQVERDDGRDIIEWCRVDAHKFVQKGRLHSPCASKYTFTWDNSYSYVNGKKLFYAVIARNNG